MIKFPGKENSNYAPIKLIAGERKLCRLFESRIFVYTRNRFSSSLYFLLYYFPFAAKSFKVRTSPAATTTKRTRRNVFRFVANKSRRKHNQTFLLRNIFSASFQHFNIDFFMNFKTLRIYSLQREIYGRRKNLFTLLVFATRPLQ